MATTSEPVRRRDSIATRQDLLDAARELFGTKGYDATSLREIGERAGVDASLIARYFGNKMALYSATIEADSLGNRLAANPRDLAGMIHRLLERVDQNGLGPIIRTLSATDVDPELRRGAQEHMQRRILDPIAERIRQDGVPDPELRAELILASLIGVATIRSSQGLARIAGATPDEIVSLLTRALEELGT